MMGRTHSRPRRADDVRPQVRGLGVRGRPRPAAPRRRDRRDRAPARSAARSAPTATSARTSRPRSSATLGLRVDPVSTQIVQRDRHAAFLAAIAILGGSLERFATEVRNLQHTEIGEVMEPFRQGQKGSSAMPHKRNPILSERIAGLARLLRGLRPDRRSRTSRCGTSATSATPRRSGWCCPTRRSCSTTCSCGRPAWSRGSWCGRSGCARTSSAASACTPRRGCCSRSWSRAGCRARTRTPSSSGVRCAPPTSGCRCASSCRRTRRSPAGCRSPTLDACFDDAALLRARARGHRPARRAWRPRVVDADAR